MNMIESVQTCFRKYSDFSGRANRSEFWWFTLFATLPFFLFESVDIDVFTFFPEGEYTPTFTTTVLSALGLSNGLFATISGLLFLVPELAVASRRLHDVNLSGWWQMAFYAVLFLDIPSNHIPLGDDTSILPAVAMLAVIVALILVWIRKGTPGLNRYGPPTDHDEAMSAFD